MPKSAAERFALAVDRVRDASLSDDEHEVAIGEMLKAHHDLLEKQGVETSTRRSIGQVISGLLLFAVVVSMVLNFSYAVTAHETANQANHTGSEVKALQIATVLNQRKGCERTNERQASQVENLEGDQTKLEGDKVKLEGEAEFIGALLPERPPALAAYLDKVHGDIAKTQADIELKEATIKEQIESVASVAKKPGSPETNCAKAYPLNRAAALVLRRQAAPTAKSGLFGPGPLELASAAR